MLMTNQQAAELAELGVGSLHDPSPLIAAKFAGRLRVSVPGCCCDKARSVRCLASETARAGGRNRIKGNLVREHRGYERSIPDFWHP